MDTIDIEIAVAQYFGYRQNLVVPNVSWGLGLHECDLLMLSKNGYLTEVEIKTSVADLKQDLKKEHEHRSKKVKQLYFAVPSKLAKHYEYIPRRAGILVVNSKHNVYCIAKAEINKDAQASTVEERYQMARLGALRIWGLKSDLQSSRSHCRGLIERNKMYEEMVKVSNKRRADDKYQIVDGEGTIWYYADSKQAELFIDFAKKFNKEDLKYTLIEE